MNIHTNTDETQCKWFCGGENKHSPNCFYWEPLECAKMGMPTIRFKLHPFVVVCMLTPKGFHKKCVHKSTNNMYLKLKKSWRCQAYGFQNSFQSIIITFFFKCITKPVTCFFFVIEHCEYCEKPQHNCSGNMTINKQIQRKYKEKKRKRKKKEVYLYYNLSKPYFIS